MCRRNAFTLVELPVVSMRKPAAFTLVELLVVIGIIALLISILMPALNKARSAALEVSCKSNLHQIMLGMIMFSNEHKGAFPGGYYDQTTHPDDEEKTDWVVGRGPSYLNGPQDGTLFRYINKDAKIFRCPALSEDGPGSGSGSNGRFDYSKFLAWTGAKVTKIRLESRFENPDGRIETVFTPIVVEEDPAHHINGCCLDSGTGSIDEAAKTHRGGANYGCVDGSVQWKNIPAGTTTYRWTSQTPKGLWQRLGDDVVSINGAAGTFVQFGDWNKL